jgi:hypothetical protein
MPKRISKRPLDVNQAAFEMVQRAGQEEQPRNIKTVVNVPKPSTSDISRVMSVMGRKGGKIGGKISSANLTPEQRKERALQAAKARWSKRKKK